VKRVARSSATRDAAEAERSLALEAAAKDACDMLGVPEGAAPIVVACSGGPDSVAVLALVRSARPHAILYACYVDHGVRPARRIAGDVRCARRAAATVGARFVRLPLPSARDAGSSREASMRERRYAALAAFAARRHATCVIVGHHRDDLAESALLALVRGSGIDGMTSMRPRRPLAPGVALARPLLWSSKLALRRYASARGLDAARDETNDDTSIRRNAIRALLHAIEEQMPGSAAAIARSVAVLANDKAALDAATVAAWRQSLAGSGVGSGDALSLQRLRSLPPGLLERVVRHAVARTGSARDFTYARCIAIARAVRERRGGSFAAGSATASISGGKLTIQRPKRAKPVAPAMRIRIPASSANVEWNGGRLTLAFRRASATRHASKAADDAGHVIHARPRTVLLDGEQLTRGTTCTLRPPKTGDRITPSGRRSAMSLARLLAKEGLTRAERAVVPLLCVGDRIAAVLGVRPDAAFAARPGGRVLEAAWRPAKGTGHRAGADE
jgi:tRNA(Ile)-lysidine synthase